MLKYNVNHYDEYLNLKISSLLWFCLIYGVRHLFFLLMMLTPDYLGYPDWLNSQSNWFFVIADIPAVFVLLATGSRIPKAHPFMRWTWLHGKHLLISSYVLGIFVFFNINHEVIQQQDIDSITLTLSVIVPDILIIFLIYKSELMKDIFNEFPPKPLRK